MKTLNYYREKYLKKIKQPLITPCKKDWIIFSRS